VVCVTPESAEWAAPPVRGGLLLGTTLVLPTKRAGAFAPSLPMTSSGEVQPEANDAEIIAAVRGGDTERFEELVRRYQPRLFATARRYARREDEVADVVQEIFLKAFSKLNSWRGDAPFEHWLMRLAVHTCYDFLRDHQRNREHNISDISDEESNWLETFAVAPEQASPAADAARTLVQKILTQLSPANRLIITLLELEDRSVKEIAGLTGWSVPLVKVRAFRARAEMKKILQRMTREQYL
jgi:RNA polymerase sigma-70 factor (ECF subfamily)